MLGARPPDPSGLDQSFALSQGGPLDQLSSSCVYAINLITINLTKTIIRGGIVMKLLHLIYEFTLGIATRTDTLKEF